MGMPYLGPLTEAMFELKKEEGPPAMIPAICWEWHRKVTEPGNLVFLWAAAVHNRSFCFSWTDITVDIAVPGVPPQPSVVVKTPAEHVERMLAPLAHAGRVRILQALFDGPLAAGDLAEAVGLRGGGLYHHLRELKYAAYVTDKDGTYDLTQLGRQMLITMAVLAHRTVEDKGEQGLGVGTVRPPDEADSADPE